jgi:predicted Zn-dependent peptidase
MKNSIKSTLLLLLLAGTMQANAQNSTEEFTVEGIKVILKQTPKEVLSVRLMVEGGTANYSEEKQGIEDLTLNLMIEGGTTTLSKLDFKTTAEKIGTTFSANTNLDYGGISMTCIKLFWDESWKLFADAIMSPAFNEADFSILKEQHIANAKATESDPDGYLALLSRKNAFPNSNYVKDPAGTPSSLAGITISDIKNYYQNTIVKKRVFFVIVGNVSKQDITKKITEAMKGMPQGTVAREEQQTILREGKILVENRDIATNYIRGILSAPAANTKDGVSMRIAMSILGDRYFTELRTKRSLSYAPAAFYANGAVNNPYSVIYISTTDPKQSMQVMVDEINKIKSEGFSEEELINTREGFLTQYYLTLETTGNQADALGAAEMQGGWEQLDGITAAVNQTTLRDINKVFDQYSKAIVWTYLGKQDMVKEEDFVQPVEKKNKPY